jgi:hypothetical protein
MEPVGARPVTRRTMLAEASLAAAGVAATGIARGSPAAAAGLCPAARHDAHVPAAWFDLALDLVRTTPGFTAPVAARAFGYAGVALFEAIAPGTRYPGGLAGR